MLMTITVMTHGYDDAEAVARTLEDLAAKVRDAGGAPVNDTSGSDPFGPRDEPGQHVETGPGRTQEVHWACATE